MLVTVMITIVVISSEWPTRPSSVGRRHRPGGFVDRGIGLGRPL
jgi:hypothetical protein